MWQLINQELIKGTDVQAVINIIKNYQSIKRGVVVREHLSVLEIKEEHCRLLIMKKLEEADFKYFIGFNPSDYEREEYDFFKAYETLKNMVELDQLADAESVQDKIIKVSNPYYGELVFYTSSSEQFFVSIISFVTKRTEEIIKLNLYDKKLRLKEYRRKYPIAMAALIYLVNVKQGNEEPELELPHHIKYMTQPSGAGTNSN